jgi:hypothetical protein
VGIGLLSNVLGLLAYDGETTDIYIDYIIYLVSISVAETVGNFR